MSTYVYLECLEHTPTLRSEGEVGQHLYDLPDIRKYVAQRQVYVDLLAQGIPVSFDSHFASNAARFLAQHATCSLGIIDEYGGTHPLVAPDPTPEPPPPAVLNLQTASAEQINAALRHYRGWRVAFDTPQAQTPSDQDGGECPDCGEALVAKWSGVECSNCKYVFCY